MRRPEKLVLDDKVADEALQRSHARLPRLPSQAEAGKTRWIGIIDTRAVKATGGAPMPIRWQRLAMLEPKLARA